MQGRYWQTGRTCSNRNEEEGNREDKESKKGLKKDNGRKSGKISGKGTEERMKACYLQAQILHYECDASRYILIKKQ